MKPIDAVSIWVGVRPRPSAAVASMELVGCQRAFECVYELHAGGGLVAVTYWGNRGQDAFWRAFFRGCLTEAMLDDREAYVATKYIKAAVAAAKGKGLALEADDKVLFDKRPALTEFMSSLEGAGGEVREPSVLMVCLHADGVRVGLKDDDAGGWLWRVGDSFSQALDAIEKALVDGTAKFGGARKGKGGKAGGK